MSELSLSLLKNKFLQDNFPTWGKSSKHLDGENHSAWVLSWWRELSSRPLPEFWQYILSGCHVCNSPTCAVHIEDCEGWWLSGCRSSVAEHWLHKPGVLGLIPGDCRPFHFPVFLPHNIFNLSVRLHTKCTYICSQKHACTVRWFIGLLLNSRSNCVQ